MWDAGSTTGWLSVGVGRWVYNRRAFCRCGTLGLQQVGLLKPVKVWHAGSTAGGINSVCVCVVCMRVCVYMRVSPG